MTTDRPTIPALLVLADGLVLRGDAFGAQGTAVGEVVFNTGMTGYQEVMTDPSYAGQLVTFTYPELGNTGVNGADQEADVPHVRGVIARQLVPQHSSWRAEDSLEAWLQRHNVVGISGLDTRALVRHLREGGAINGAISSDGSTPQQLLERVRSAPSMAGLNLAEQVTTAAPYEWEALCAAAFDQRRQQAPERPYRVVAIDFGIKRAILERLAAHGCAVTVLPASASLQQVLELNPEGVFLSNGPGDPSAVSGGIALAQGLLQQPDLPMFGICLGHQILGLALGGQHLQARLWAPRSEPPLRQPRQRGDHQPEPRLRPGCRLPARGLRGGHPRQPQRPHRGGSGPSPAAGVRRAIPPGGQPGPPRRRSSLRSLCRPDGPAPPLRRGRGDSARIVAGLSVPKTLPTLRSPVSSEVRSHHGSAAIDRVPARWL